MSKILFMNGSPNKNGNTYIIGEEILKKVDHEVLQMSDYKISQYGQVYEDDQIKELLGNLKDVDTLVIGSPVYWYTVSGIVKTFIDRLYMLPEAEVLQGKKLYFFAQGSAPDEDTVKSITFLVNRLCSLMEMELKNVVIDQSSGSKIKSIISIEE